MVRGPVPGGSETFTLAADGDTTQLTYHGLLGTNLGAAGAAWGRLVARRWERAVAAILAAVKDEAERRIHR